MIVETFLYQLARSIPIFYVPDIGRFYQLTFHVLYNIAWCSWWFGMREHTKWWKFFILIAIFYVPFQELFLDGHIYRLFLGTETLDSYRDFVSDVVSKYIGIAIGCLPILFSEASKIFYMKRY